MRPQLALDTKTTYQKVEAIYDWITEKVRYDYSHLNNNSYLLQFTAYAPSGTGRRYVRATPTCSIVWPTMRASTAVSSPAATMHGTSSR